MNIFVTDIDPVISAINLDDKRVKHMPKECFEIISIAIFKNTGKCIAPFIIWNREARTRPNKFQELFNHKCCLWAASKRENLWWIWCHAFALMQEYKYRTGNHHYLLPLFNSIAHYIPVAKKYPNNFADCSGHFQYDDSLDIFTKYQSVLNYKWFNTDLIMPVVWTNRNKPKWAKPLILVTQGKFNFDGSDEDEEIDELPF
jgi:hypothetical protein